MGFIVIHNGDYTFFPLYNIILRWRLLAYVNAVCEWGKDAGRGLLKMSEVISKTALIVNDSV
jgi:hypothetical protein